MTNLSKRSKLYRMKIAALKKARAARSRNARQRAKDRATDYSIGKTVSSIRRHGNPFAPSTVLATADRGSSLTAPATPGDVKATIQRAVARLVQATLDEMLA
jgi:hypothetical protein